MLLSCFYIGSPKILWSFEPELSSWSLVFNHNLEKIIMDQKIRSMTANGNQYSKAAGDVLNITGHLHVASSTDTINKTLKFFLQMQ